MAGFKQVTGVAQAFGGVKDRLPLEHFAKNSELRFFLEIIYLFNVVDWKNPNFIAGVTLNSTRGVDLLVNIEKIEALSIPEQMFVMAHEVGHVIYNHFLRGINCTNQMAWNIATDAVINYALLKTFPNDLKPLTDKNGTVTCVMLEDLIAHKLIDMTALGKTEPADLTSEEVYEQLMKNAKKTSCPMCGGKGKGKSQSKSGSQRGGEGEGEGAGSGKGDEEGEGDNNCPVCGGKGMEGLDKKRFDQHDPELTEDNLSRDIAVQIGDIAKAAEDKVYGSGAGNFVRALLNTVRKPFPFKQILDKVLYKENPDWKRRNRRLKIPKSFLPRRRTEHFKIYAAVDVSGSCYDYTEDFLGYIMALPEFELVYLFDDGIQQTIKKGEAIPNTSRGGGGTDLNPCMAEFVKFEKENPKCNFVILTDGYIPPLKTGPVKSKVVVLTTGDEVHWEKSKKKYVNYKIEVNGRKSK